MSLLALSQSLLSALAVLYVIAAGGLYALQEKLIFPAPDVMRWGDIDIDGFQRQAIETPDGETLAALYHPPQRQEPVIVFFHGNGDAAPFLGDVARPLAAAGFGVLLAEYRGYGGSSGAPSEQGLYVDGLASVDFLRTQGAQHIGLYGHSLGTAVAIHVAAQRDVFAVVLDSPFDSMLALASARYPWLPVGLMLRHPFRSDLQIGRITAPIAMRHGDRDQVIPIAHARRLWSLAPEGTTFETLEGAGHNDLDRFGAIRKAITFFRQHTP